MLKKDIEETIKKACPLMIRLAWHSAGTYDTKDGSGGSNGATMRHKLEASDDANNGLDIARKMNKIAFIGTSVPMLFYVYQYSKKNRDHDIFIYENRDVVGGAWFTISNSYANNIDHGLHYIPCLVNNVELYKKLFGEFNISLKQIDSYENEVSQLKCILYSESGWGDLKDQIYESLKSLGVTFVNEKVESIIVRNNECNLNTGSIFSKVFLPAYIDIEKVEVNKEIIKLPMTLMTTTHVLLFFKCDEIRYTENYHAILQDVTDFYYDRIMFVTEQKHFKTEEANVVAYLRVSRSFKESFKSLNYIENALNFLNKKKLISTNAKLIDHTITEYTYPFRADYVDMLQKQINNSNIEMLDTRSFETIIDLCINSSTNAFICSKIPI